MSCTTCGGAKSFAPPVKSSAPAGAGRPPTTEGATPLSGVLATEFDVAEYVARRIKVGPLRDERRS
jgi:hypothetical protein